MGFEPTRPCEHQPLKLASLPISPRGREQKKPSTCPTFCDLTGARTQDPIIKSDVLYQLSYQVIFISSTRVQIYDLIIYFSKQFSYKFVFFLQNLSKA